MRPSFLLLPFSFLTLPAFGQPIGPAADPAVDAARREATWADLEARRRISDGDYEGAVRAQAQADANRRAAERLETFARMPATPR